MRRYDCDWSIANFRGERIEDQRRRVWLCCARSSARCPCQGKPARLMDVCCSGNERLGRWSRGGNLVP